MTLLHQIPFNEMFPKLRYLISKLGHIMQISFNVFNFGTGADSSVVGELVGAKHDQQCSFI